MFRSYNYKDVLTRASITIQIIDDIALYKATIFSTNGNIFNINDTTSDITLMVKKGVEDITDRFTDIVWSRFHVNAGKYEEDLEWGNQHYGKKTFTLHRNDILEKANIQVAVYDRVNGERTLVAADFLSFTDVNDMQGSEIPPENPKHGDLWLDTSVTPPRLMMWDDSLKQWIEVTMAGNDRRNLLRNSNFYKKNFDYWTPVGEPTLEIESFSGRKWARIYCSSNISKHKGISQIVSAAPKAVYSFQMISSTYIQSLHPNGNVLVAAYSINGANEKILIEEKMFDINETVNNYNFSFKTYNDTEKIEIIISGNSYETFDFVITNTKLEKYSIPTEWEIAIEDIQDALDNKVGNSFEEVFDSLTDGGRMQGIYMDVDEEGNKNYYVNASYIKSGYINGERIDAKNLKVIRDDGTPTLVIDQHGNITIRASSLEIGGDGTYVPVASEEDIAYKIEIKSTNGLIFYNGQIQTQLIAKVYKGKDDVTDQLDEKRFIWTKTFEDGKPDTEWNESQGKYVKSIYVTNNDVRSKSTFECSVMSDSQYLQYKNNK